MPLFVVHVAPLLMCEGLRLRGKVRQLLGPQAARRCSGPIPGQVARAIKGFNALQGDMRPDVLIVEGLNVLQARDGQSPIEVGTERGAVAGGVSQGCARLATGQAK